MSAIRKNAMATTSGRTRSRRESAPALFAPMPIRTVEQSAIAVISAQAGIGIRFNQAACVQPSHFRRVGGRQQVGSDVFGANRVGLL